MDYPEPPVLEDNLSVTCGAKVLGDVTVYSGSLATADAAVVKAVSPKMRLLQVCLRK